jgi:Ni/Fe-hydrogenase 1 B-type cytochrome subunit
MALTILILIATGFYIARPFVLEAGETVDKFFMGSVRFVHVLFGLFLVFTFIWRVYLGFVPAQHASWKNFLAFTEWKNLITQIKFYTFVSKKKPERNYLYGPLQAMAYAGIFLMVFLIIITGLILMGGNYTVGITGVVYAILRPVERMMGGLAGVRYVHHILTWLFILFIFVHIYMAFWYDVIFKEGTVSSMINGRTFVKIKK